MGFDTSIAIQTLYIEVIKDIQGCINFEKLVENKDMAEQLRKAQYIKINPFAFLPGYKALLLGSKEK